MSNNSDIKFKDRQHRAAADLRYSDLSFAYWYIYFTS